MNKLIETSAQIISKILKEIFLYIRKDKNVLDDLIC